jgi:hypothetical protein
LRPIIFVLICLFVLAASLLDLRFGVFLVWVELLIGSKGYLFFLNLGTATISIRIALWLIVMSVWFGQLVIQFIRRWRSRRPRQAPTAWQFIYSPFFVYFSLLFLFVFWGIVNGFLNHNNFNNIFFDANAWLYFTLIFPFYAALQDKQDVIMLWRLFMAAVVWLSLKTLFLLFLFTHFGSGILTPIYRWIRETGVGEITKMPSGFYRIFFQSHLFVLFAFLLVLVLVCQRQSRHRAIFKNKDLWLSVLFLAVILVSFSRSYWVGLVGGLGIFIFWLIKQYSFKQAFAAAGQVVAVGFLSLGLIMLITKFPYPRPATQFNATNVLTERATAVKNEAAVASRWALWPKLWQKIKAQPILGQGFGTTVTYRSSDPRILSSTVDGIYTTYAFEWGWLDIWLKLGIFGLIFYFLLIVNLLLAAFGQTKEKKPAQGVILKTWSEVKRFFSFFVRFNPLKVDGLLVGLGLGLIVVAVVNFFSPYLNHPLGIGYLLATAATLDKFRQ